MNILMIYLCIYKTERKFYNLKYKLKSVDVIVVIIKKKEISKEFQGI